MRIVLQKQCHVEDMARKTLPLTSERVLLKHIISAQIAANESWQLNLVEMILRDLLVIFPSKQKYRQIELQISEQLHASNDCLLLVGDRVKLV